jgi:hypothetical protein
MKETAATPRCTEGLVWTLLLLGAAVRLRPYAIGRSLWLDEASLALNIAGRSFTELRQPLAYQQVAPIPFLWAVKLATWLGGANEWTLRLVPLLAGLLLPWTTWRLARRLLGETGGLLSLALVSLTPGLVDYSNELKPYGLDALMAVALVLAAQRTRQAPDSLRRWWMLGGVGVLAVLVSLPAVLVVPGVLGALVLTPTVQGQWRRLVLCAGAWGVCFLGPYLIFYRAASSSAYLKRYWEASFLSPLAPVRAVTALAGALQQNLLGTPTPWQVLCVAALCTLGMVALAKRREWATLALLAGPLLAMALASFNGRYPLVARTTLFQVPLAVILMVAGARLLGSRVPTFPKSSVLVSGWIFLMPGLMIAGQQLFTSRARPDAKPVLQALAAKRGDVPLYVYARSIPVWAFYATDWTQPGSARWIQRAADLGGASFENAEARGHPVEDEGEAQGSVLLGVSTGVQFRPGFSGPLPPVDPGWAAHEARRIRAVAQPRVWLLFSHTVDAGDQLLRAELEQQGAVLVDQLTSGGAAAYEYRFPE